MPQNRIRELREQQGLKQSDLALALGVDQATISRWEAGRQIPDRGKQHLAEVLKVSVPFLMGWSDGNNGENGQSAAA